MSRLEQAAGPQLYNLSCAARRMFPRPTLSLLRYRAGPLGAEQRQVAGSAIGRLRPRLAATLLRAEPLEGAHTQTSLVGPDGADSNSILDERATFDATSWALVDEASLSSKLASQFECQLSIEGTGYERRQALTLRRGK